MIRMNHVIKICLGVALLFVTLVPVVHADDFKLMMLVALVALPLIFLLRRAAVHPGEMAVLE